MTTPKTWFLTGCSSGLGRSLAVAALAAGHRVVATARDPSTLADLAGDACRTLPLDVTDPASVRAAVAAAGPFDVLVNNAGRGLLGAVEECDDAEVRANFETNLFGPLAVIREALPMFRAQRSGHVFNVSAAAAIANYPGMGAYGAAKAALEFLSESLRLELAPLGVRVTVVEPGPFRTDFVGRSLDRAARTLPDYDGTAGRFARLVGGMHGKQPGDPAKAARAILAAAEAEAPPMRLVLGKYANDKARRRAAERERERTDWEGVALPTEHGPST
jgi:NAD(P)-dependent dehydrogenase (short-subunit alcohol dehydrogenase family)